MKLPWLAVLMLNLSVHPMAALRAEPSPAFATLVPLIGQWNVGPEGGATAFIQRFVWGPKEAYVWVQVVLVLASGDERLHFEGPILWNGATKRYDYLFAVEPGSLAQERGEMYATEGGEIVRDVVLTAADGTTSRFRQTFHPMDDGRFVTTLMRQTADGWVPTFPGSERLIMMRRPS
ncbi:MAG TPA: hypothetical protein VFR29_03895 [Steroidobacteraceae bacterium]|nr:hypothetical protein [Steroidobacteraceae bacterium]